MVAANGLRFRTLAAGPQDGEPILLLHGFPEGADSWTPQLETLGAAGMRAVALDLRGYGGSDAPQDPAAYSIGNLVADVTGVLDALGWKSAHLAGHDWGSLLGWSVVSRHPVRIRTWTALSVGHPVAVAEAAFTDPDQKQRSAYILLLREVGRAEAVLSADGYERLRTMYRMGPDPDAIPAGLIDRYLAGFARPGRLTAALNYYRTALPELAPSMGPVTVSTRLLWGTADPALGPAGTRATASRVEGPYRLIELDGAGHWLQFERPAEVAAHILDHVRG